LDCVVKDFARARPPVLKRFTSCDTLVNYAEKHAPQVSRWYSSGGTVEDGTPVPPTAAPSPAKGGVPEDTSTTNNQEEGVDEPDRSFRAPPRRRSSGTTRGSERSMV